MKISTILSSSKRYIIRHREDFFEFLILFAFSMLLFLVDVQVFDASEVPLYILMSGFLSAIVVFPRKAISKHFDLSVSYRFWYMGFLLSVILTLGSGLLGFYALFPIIGSLDYKRNRRTFTGIKSSEVSNREKSYVSLLMLMIFVGLGLLLILAAQRYAYEALFQSGLFLVALSFVSILPYHKLEGLPLFYHNVFLYGIIAALLLLILASAAISLILAAYLFVAFVLINLLSKQLKLL
ncbi:MAG: hypothetical protein ACP5MT_03260 [Candidatus Acidifodinimicrobium sp.]